ncbi:hypothetical protein RRG08_028710 [Elysia crispata]|uniref:Uncharacterized protein n=1 Tax=Elysia crispata TaxID=231223 RepID=A0AAE0XNB1_9GAST|nr:hypothetical protein RRG08_028710 [Elysia crispata]
MREKADNYVKLRATAVQRRGRILILVVNIKTTERPLLCPVVFDVSELPFPGSSLSLSSLSTVRQGQMSSGDGAANLSPRACGISGPQSVVDGTTPVIVFVLLEQPQNPSEKTDLAAL